MKHNSNSYYMRRRRALNESRVNAMHSVGLFIERLETLCDDMEWLKNGEADDDYNGYMTRVSNMKKNIDFLVHLYSTDDAFIPEFTYEPGYTADKNFAESMEEYDLDFIEAMKTLSTALGNLIDGGTENTAGDTWEFEMLLIEPVRAFIKDLRKDYLI